MFSEPRHGTPSVAQKLAITSSEGAICVFGGAGTGKTRTLASRAMYLITQRKVEPSQIFMTTFSRSAARALERRLRQAGSSGIQVQTSHAAALQMLRTYPALASLRDDFTVLGREEQKRLLVQAADGSGASRPPPILEKIARQIIDWKNRGLDPEDVPYSEVTAEVSREAAAAYGAYQAILSRRNAVDFADFFLHTIRILKQHPHVLERCQEEARYILVDEYQDMNEAQVSWLQLLASRHRNICVAADINQVIYGWRGADLRAIKRFQADFPTSTQIQLEQNYRSPPHLRAVAEALLANNSRDAAALAPVLQQTRDRIDVVGVWDGNAEGLVVTGKVQQWKQSGRSYNECAIVVRAAWQTAIFEDYFSREGIPFVVTHADSNFDFENIEADAAAEDSNGVAIMTLHSAAGLEWPMVFLPGWEEEVFPSRRSLDEQGTTGLEEERRLAYVGITRARERACISFAANRQVNGRWISTLPSRFVDELPAAYVDAVSETGYVSPNSGSNGTEVKFAWHRPSTNTMPTDRIPGSKGSNLNEPERGVYQTPGWRRAAASQKRGETPPTDSIVSSSGDTEPRTMVVGQRVEHAQFGIGYITDVDGEKLAVRFDSHGPKKILAKFVKIA